MKMYVHDFYFEYFEIENNDGDDDFICSVNVFFNFSKQDPGDGWEDLEYLNVFVASPFGVAKYLSSLIKRNIYPKSFFFPHLLIFEKNDKELIKTFIKNELESTVGRAEKEILFRVMRNFGWENEGDVDVNNDLYR